ncbi:MAG: phosphoglycolate phosphatase [Hydrocarboniphaga sp.]|uniref:phosphoglycolate phosphatase n=1 Tax=Hydrocarboniphaga sp. TaxID=2033016 RepID=UPI00261E676F|nr:phosphoglycolate phosphatase [Hydrocarboniphaga sp.]MDB5969697.1 phosphoglycolate phosphatase [Hydrocarboniphaga sp.]
MRLIIFDLDGTLVDSLPDLVQAVNAAMADYGCPPVGRERVAPWVGRGSRVLLQLALDHHAVDSAAPGFDFERAFARFMVHYGEHLLGETRLYKGVADTLAALSGRGITMAVCTNKPERFVAPLLQALGIGHYFAALLGGDSLAERKPHPAPLLHLARQFGVAPGDCLMVGDSRHDVEAARAAGMAVVGLSYGYGGDRDFAIAPPDRVLAAMAELPAWLDHCNARLR